MMMMMWAMILLTLMTVSITAQAASVWDSDDDGGGGGGEVAYVSDWAASDGWSSDPAWSSGGRLQHSKCVDIPANMSLCSDIGYHQMRLPNLLEHDTLNEMTQQAAQWVPLLRLGCHPDTKMFLCSLFSPVCLDRPIWPCRTLCEAVKTGCEIKMLRYGYPWPEMLRCEKFPLDNDMCISPQTSERPDESVCAACGHPETFEAVVDDFCSSDFTVRVLIDRQVVADSDLKITAKKKKKKKFKASQLTKKDLRDLTMYVERGAKCDCPQLRSVGGKDRVVLMGEKQDGGRLVITRILRVDRNNRETRRSIKAIQKDKDICKGGLSAIGDGAPTKQPRAKKPKEKENGNGSNRRRGGGGGRKKNDNGSRKRAENERRRKRNRNKRKNAETN